MSGIQCSVYIMFVVISPLYILQGSAVLDLTFPMSQNYTFPLPWIFPVFLYKCLFHSLNFFKKENFLYNVFLNVLSQKVEWSFSLASSSCLNLLESFLKRLCMSLQLFFPHRVSQHLKFCLYTFHRCNIPISSNSHYRSRASVKGRWE